MPEFYNKCNCKYQLKAQPYLDAIALGLRDNPKARSFLIRGTDQYLEYENATILWREQWQKRDPRDKMKSPFWSNY